MTSFILDGVIVTLLITTIIYAMRLNAKLNLLKNQNQTMASTIKAFNDATETAIIAVEELHIKGEDICRQIDERVKLGKNTCDDLEFLVSRASKKANDLQVHELKPAEVKRSNQSIAEVQMLRALKERQIKQALAGMRTN